MTELYVLKYKEVINGTNGNAWKCSVENGHEQMIKHEVWRPMKKSQFPKGTRILGLVCFMKKKADGTSLGGGLTAHGCSQKDRDHYDSSLINDPIMIDVMICIILNLMLMAIRKHESLIRRVHSCMEDLKMTKRFR